MAQSRHRHKHPHHHQQPHPASHVARKRRDPSLTMAIFIGLVGFGISLFASNMDITWTIAGTLAGAGAGYLFGRAIAKGTEK
jgi:glutamate formiminotransferase